MNRAVSVFDVIQRMPDLASARRVSRALAVLDLVLNDGRGRELLLVRRAVVGDRRAALMRDGSGNEYSIVFSADGAFGYGFDHESPMSPYVNDMRPGRA